MLVNTISPLFIILLLVISVSLLTSSSSSSSLVFANILDQADHNVVSCDNTFITSTECVDGDRRPFFYNIGSDYSQTALDLELTFEEHDIFVNGSNNKWIDYTSIRIICHPGCTRINVFNNNNDNNNNNNNRMMQTLIIIIKTVPHGVNNLTNWLDPDITIDIERVHIPLFVVSHWIGHTTSTGGDQPSLRKVTLLNKVGNVNVRVVDCKFNGTVYMIFQNYSGTIGQLEFVGNNMTLYPSTGNLSLIDGDARNHLIYFVVGPSDAQPDEYRPAERLRIDGPVRFENNFVSCSEFLDDSRRTWNRFGGFRDTRRTEMYSSMMSVLFTDAVVIGLPVIFKNNTLIGHNCAERGLFVQAFGKDALRNGVFTIENPSGLIIHDNHIDLKCIDRVSPCEVTAKGIETDFATFVAEVLDVQRNVIIGDFVEGFRGYSGTYTGEYFISYDVPEPLAKFQSGLLGRVDVMLAMDSCAGFLVIRFKNNRISSVGGTTGGGIEIRNWAREYDIMDNIINVTLSRFDLAALKAWYGPDYKVDDSNEMRSRRRLNGISFPEASICALGYFPHDKRFYGYSTKEGNEFSQCFNENNGQQERDVYSINKDINNNNNNNFRQAIAPNDRCRMCNRFVNNTITCYAADQGVTLGAAFTLLHGAPPVLQMVNSPSNEKSPLKTAANAQFLDPNKNSMCRYEFLFRRNNFHIETYPVTTQGSTALGVGLISSSNLAVLVEDSTLSLVAGSGSYSSVGLALSAGTPAGLDLVAGGLSPEDLNPEVREIVLGTFNEEILNFDFLRQLGMHVTDVESTPEKHALSMDNYFLIRNNNITSEAIPPVAEDSYGQSTSTIKKSDLCASAVSVTKYQFVKDLFITLQNNHLNFTESRDYQNNCSSVVHLQTPKPDRLLKSPKNRRPLKNQLRVEGDDNTLNYTIGAKSSNEFSIKSSSFFYFQQLSTENSPRVSDISFSGSKFTYNYQNPGVSAKSASLFRLPRFQNDTYPSSFLVERAQFHLIRDFIYNEDRYWYGSSGYLYFPNIFDSMPYVFGPTSVINVSDVYFTGNFDTVTGFYSTNPVIFNPETSPKYDGVLRCSIWPPPPPPMITFGVNETPPVTPAPPPPPPSQVCKFVIPCILPEFRSFSQLHDPLSAAWDVSFAGSQCESRTRTQSQSQSTAPLCGDFDSLVTTFHPQVLTKIIPGKRVRRIEIEFKSTNDEETRKLEGPVDNNIPPSPDPTTQQPQVPPGSNANNSNQPQIVVTEPPSSFGPPSRWSRFSPELASSFTTSLEVRVEDGEASSRPFTILGARVRRDGKIADIFVDVNTQGVDMRYTSIEGKIFFKDDALLCRPRSNRTAAQTLSDNIELPRPFSFVPPSVVSAAMAVVSSSTMLAMPFSGGGGIGVSLATRRFLSSYRVMDCEATANVDMPLDPFDHPLQFAIDESYAAGALVGNGIIMIVVYLGVFCLYWYRTSSSLAASKYTKPELTLRNLIWAGHPDTFWSFCTMFVHGSVFAATLEIASGDEHPGIARKVATIGFGVPLVLYPLIHVLIKAPLLPPSTFKDEAVPYPRHVIQQHDQKKINDKKDKKKKKNSQEDLKQPPNLEDLLIPDETKKKNKKEDNKDEKLKKKKKNKKSDDNSDDSSDEDKKSNNDNNKNDSCTGGIKRLLFPYFGRQIIWRNKHLGSGFVQRYASVFEELGASSYLAIYAELALTFVSAIFEGLPSNSATFKTGQQACSIVGILKILIAGVSLILAMSRPYCIPALNVYGLTVNVLGCLSILLQAIDQYTLTDASSSTSSSTIMELADLFMFLIFWIGLFPLIWFVIQFFVDPAKKMKRIPKCVQDIKAIMRRKAIEEERERKMNLKMMMQEEENVKRKQQLAQRLREKEEELIQRIKDKAGNGGKRKARGLDGEYVDDDEMLFTVDHETKQSVRKSSKYRKLMEKIQLPNASSLQYSSSSPSRQDTTSKKNDKDRHHRSSHSNSDNNHRRHHSSSSPSRKRNDDKKYTNSRRHNNNRYENNFDDDYFDEKDAHHLL